MDFRDTVKRVTPVTEIGTAVNPKTARSQVIGGIVSGIGMALLEGSHLEEMTRRYAWASSVCGRLSN